LFNFRTDSHSSALLVLGLFSFLVGCSDDESDGRRWSLNDTLLIEESGLRPGKPFVLPSLLTIGGDQSVFKTKLALVNQTGLERRLVRVLKGCGCTKVDYHPAVIADGRQLSLRVNVSTAGLESLEGRWISFRPVFEDGQQLSFKQRIFNLPRIVELVGEQRHAGAMLSVSAIAPGSRLEVRKNALVLSKGGAALPVDLSVVARPDAITAIIEDHGVPIEMGEYAGVEVVAVPCRLRLTSTKNIERDLAYTNSFRDSGKEIVVCSGQVSVEQAFVVRPKELILKGQDEVFFSVTHQAADGYEVESLEYSKKSFTLTQQTTGKQKAHQFLIKAKQDTESTGQSFVETEISISTSLGETVSLNVVLLCSP